MASNLDLLNKCKRYLLTDYTQATLDAVIQDSLITACREIAALGGARPLAWLREVYDELFTKYYATISAITNANPGVISAISNDPLIGTGEFDFVFPFNFASHGYATGDIVYIEGINGTNTEFELNNRLFRAVDIDGETLSLKSLNGNTAVNTTNYMTYSSGGYIYHAGMVLSTSSIEPTGGTAAYEWDIKRVYDVKFDNFPSDPITDEDAVKKGMNHPGSRPKKWRYQRYSYSNFQAGTVEHILLWYPYASHRYNISVDIEKIYPDLSTFSSSVYPPHPPEIHDCIWHRALSILSTMGSERAKRRGINKDGAETINTRMEVLNANYWIQKAAQEEIEILDYSRKMDGDQAYISQGMGA